jgi:hypothetical protein
MTTPQRKKTHKLPSTPNTVKMIDRKDQEHAKFLVNEPQLVYALRRYLQLGKKTRQIPDAI